MLEVNYVLNFEFYVIIYIKFWLFYSLDWVGEKGWMWYLFLWWVWYYMIFRYGWYVLFLYVYRKVNVVNCEWDENF